MDKALKDKKEVNGTYIAKLKQYLLDSQATYFSDVNKATSFSDICRFPSMIVDRHHLCMPSEPMLIDRSHHGEHMYCVCTISEKNKITMEIPVIRVSELTYGLWRNGYFLLPIL